MCLSGVGQRSFYALGLGLSLYFAMIQPWPSQATPTSDTYFTIESVSPAPTKSTLSVRQNTQLYRINLKGHCQVHTGQTILWNISESKTHKLHNPGSFDYDQWLRSQGFSGAFSLRCEDLRFGPSNPPSWTHWIGGLRETLHQKLLSALPQPMNGLLLAMLIGNDDFLDPTLASDFKLTGLSHVLAISGFHIALFALILHLCIGLLTPKRAWHYAITMGFLLIYGPLTGNPPSVGRAIVFYAIYGLSMASGRKGTALNSLYLCAALMLLWDPKQILDIGFQLSFAATFALLYQPFAPELPKLSPWRAQFKNLISDPFWATCKALLITAPILAYHFHTLSPAALVGNFFAVPLSTAFMISGALGSLDPQHWTQPFAISAVLCYQLLELGMHGLAQIPGMQWFVNLNHPLLVWAWISATLLIPLLRFFSARILFYLCTFTLLAYPLGRQIQSLLDPRMELWFLDIGQGDATLIRTPAGSTILVDDGPQNFYTGKDQYSSVLAPFFKSQGIHTLDALILTHADLDHIGASLSLLQNMKVKTIWINPQDYAQPKPELQKIIDYAHQQGIPFGTLRAGQKFVDGAFQMEVLHPIFSNYPEANHASVVLKPQWGTQSALLTGDLEEIGEEDFLTHNPDSLIQSQILKIGHHGSRNGSQINFLQKVQPDFAFISCGDRNRYHHPHSEILQRLTSLNIPFQISAQKGALHLSASPNNWYFIDDF